ncbi:MAG: galactose oxidase [Verrucomicrobia bacterium]|nr:galactose oxidase [Verrucomicrobiota bacterium]
MSIFLFLASLTGLTHAQVPGLLSYQGRVFSGAAAFEGNGQFKFALLNADGSVVYWLNHPDGNGDGQPDNAVTVGVTRGLYSVLLGDSSLPNMAGIAPSVFSNSSVHLRVWFNDGTSGFQQLTPDQRLAAVGYALMAAGVADGVITEQKLSSSLSGTITGLNQQIQALSARLDGLLASGLTVASSSGADSSLLAQGFDLFSTVPAPAWANGNTAGAASARYGHTAVWTGSQMVVWGGSLAPGVYSSSGSIYTPLSDVWTPVSPVAVPSARTGHSAIWTGQKMLVWGGFSANGYLNSGGAFTPGSQQWSPISTAGPLTGRSGQVAVWTGSRMFVWGGRNSTGLLGDGALYDPATDQWSAVSLANPPAARSDAVALWAGDRVLIWGGQGPSGAVASGMQLVFDNSGNPVEWRAISASAAPSARQGHRAVWTGTRMIIWGGENAGAFLGDGAMYDPVANVWTGLTGAGAPSARTAASGVWTGREFVVFGGQTAAGTVSDGGAYDPEAARWRELSAQGAPVSRSDATMIWSGTQLLVFGGQSGSQAFAALQRLDPKPTWYFYRKQ